MTQSSPAPLDLPITTQRLILRDYVAADGDAVRSYMRDPSHWAYQLTAPPTDAHIDFMMQKIIEDQSAPVRSDYFLCVSLKTAPDSVIGEGVVKITHLQNRQGEIGFGVAPSYWGQGYGREIATALIATAFKHLKVHRVVGRCSPDNLASRRVMEEIGMVQEAMLRDLHFARGRWWGTAIYGMLEDEYAKQTQ